MTERNSRVPGLLVSADGLVMVRGHVKFQNAEPFNFKVRIGQGEDEREYDAVLLQKPDRVNVCFLRIEQKDAPRFPYVAFAKDVSLRVGEPVLLVGVLGQALDYTPNVSVRRVSAVLDKPRPTYCLDDAVPFGGVGGPVIDGQGRIVGVVGFDLSPAEGGDLYVRHGHPLIYPTDLFAEYIANPPTETGEVDGEDDAWLGVFTQPLSDDLAAYWGLEQDGGIVVSTLVEGGPGTDAGLRRGDVIVRFNDMPVNAKLDREVLGFTKMVRDAGAGARVPIRLLRDGKPMELSVTLAKRPTTAHDAGEFEDSVVGLTVRELTTDVRILLNLPEDVRGVIVPPRQVGKPGRDGRVPAGVHYSQLRRPSRRGFGGVPRSGGQG